MTDKNRYKVKTEFGADREADRILARLPRNLRPGHKALVYVDASGNLQIALDGGGILTIRERDLVKVHGDELA